MRRRAQKCWIWAVLSLGAVLAGGTGCITIANTVATPSALEHQLLGVYAELDKDLVLAASVRGSVAAPAGSLTAKKSLALDGRALQRFHEDDLVELKSAGCLAEGISGQLVERPCSLIESDEAAARRRKRVVEDENRARRYILDWAAFTLARNEGRQAPDASEVDELRRTYHRLLREGASPGHVFEIKPGVFEEVPR